MPATKFVCPDGQRVDIADCLRSRPKRCMFMPTLRAVDPASVLYVFHGQAVHSINEQHTQGEILSEERLIA